MVMTTSQWNKADRRESARVGLELRLALVYPQREGRPARPMFHGKTHDIGLSGLSMVVDYNIFQEGEVAVVLALPPTHAGASRRAVTCAAEMSYAIHSSKLDAYKIGLRFREFRGNGRELLDAVLRQTRKQERRVGAHAASTRSRGSRAGDSQPRGW